MRCDLYEIEADLPSRASGSYTKCDHRRELSKNLIRYYVINAFTFVLIFIMFYFRFSFDLTLVLRPAPLSIHPSKGSNPNVATSYFDTLPLTNQR